MEYFFHDSRDLSLGEDQFAILYQFYGAFEGPHVHVLDDLLDQSIFEKTSVELNNIRTVASTEILPQVIEKLFSLVRLNSIDRLDCKYILIASLSVDSSSDLCSTSFANNLKFLRNKTKSLLLVFWSIFWPSQFWSQGWTSWQCHYYWQQDLLWGNIFIVLIYRWWHVYMTTEWIIWSS